MNEKWSIQIGERSFDAGEYVWRCALAAAFLAYYGLADHVGKTDLSAGTSIQFGKVFVVANPKHEGQHIDTIPSSAAVAFIEAVS